MDQMAFDMHFTLWYLTSLYYLYSLERWALQSVFFTSYLNWNKEDGPQLISPWIKMMMFVSLHCLEESSAPPAIQIYQPEIMDCDWLVAGL